jgi:serine/threonine protein kinase/tetratricopeptide (TPR) repeat protein
MNLGPFELGPIIGRGGMGEVRAGRHRSEGLDVAVKLVTATAAPDAAFLARFAHEVRAVARLDHSGVVRVFDHGRVDADAAAESAGAIQGGSPYLVMERASGGTLADGAVIDWDAAHGLLLDLLDALAHAHARGVVHRDLKPNNVLRCVDGDLRPGWKLADFGIAWASVDEHGKSHERPKGTPTYMAPEQLRGAWRDYGPWTDLYALGCLGWELLTGEPPFGHGDTPVLKRAHLYEDPPAFRPRIPVPAGVEPWLLRLLHKEPSRRFERAADAAFALRALDAASGGAMLVVPGGAEPTVFLDDETELPTGQTTTQAELSGESATRDTRSLETSEAGRSLAARRRPALPSDWRSAPTPADRHLHGVGLGLYGVRPIPLVGRERERDVLWDALRDVEAVGEPRLVLLHGVAGVGKSRLAEWLAERAHELGVAHVVQATHSPLGGPNDGLSRMIASSLRCLRLPRADLVARTVAVLREQGLDDPDVWNGLAEVMLPANEPDLAGKGNRRRRFGSPAQRYDMIERWLSNLAANPSRPARPVIVHLDDVQWGTDAIAFTERLLQRSKAPILLVLTARDEALAEQPLAAARLAALMARPGATDVDVPALSGPERRTLVRNLLGLSGELAASVEDRTRGNPLFAIHLVGDWVQRGVLEADTRGFGLRSGASAVLPDDLHAVWTERLHRLVASDDELRALELAAALGQDVDGDEWRDACSLAGIPLPTGLVDRMSTARLGRGRDGGWSFAHGMLRECLERLSIEGGRWAGHHRACAAMLRARSGRAERVGRHLLGAGDVDGALAPLLKGARERGDASEYRAAHGLLELRESKLSPDDARYWEGRALRAWILTREGRLAPARAQADEVLAAALAGGWPPVEADARELVAYCARHTGRLRDAVERYREARDAHAIVGQQAGVASCTLNLGGLARVFGRLEEADALHREALATFRAIGDPRGVALATDGLGILARTRGRFDEALELHGEALVRFEQLGDLVGTAEVMRGLGEVARARADLDKAEGYFRRGAAMLADAESEWATIYGVYPAFVQLYRGNFAVARRELEGVLTAMKARDEVHYVGAVDVVLLVCAAFAQDWDAWDGWCAEGTRYLADTGFIDPEIAIAARMAGEIATGLAQAGRGRDALRIAAAQWRALGAEDKALEIDRLLAG